MYTKLVEIVGIVDVPVVMRMFRIGWRGKLIEKPAKTAPKQDGMKAKSDRFFPTAARFTLFFLPLDACFQGLSPLFSERKQRIRHVVCTGKLGAAGV